jgi:virginiamycin A acetyltransferase
MKSFSKIIAASISVLAVLLPYCLYGVGRLLFGADKAFPAWSQAFSLIPGLSGAYLRRAFYKLVFDRCGAGASIGFGTVFSHRACSIGRDVYVGVYCCLGEVTLEDDVLIGSHVSIMNGSAQHGIDRLDIPVREQPGRWPHVTIGQDTWVGDRAVVMADVGRHCVIGAGAVVTKAVPDFAIAVGVPARIVGYRTGAGATGGDRPLTEVAR